MPYKCCDPCTVLSGDIAALDEHLHKIGIVDVLHSSFPSRDPDARMSDADKAVVLTKLLNHARLHHLFVAEKLQEHLVSPETQESPSSSKVVPCAVSFQQ